MSPRTRESENLMMMMMMMMMIMIMMMREKTTKKFNDDDDETVLHGLSGLRVSGGMSNAGEFNVRII